MIAAERRAEEEKIGPEKKNLRFEIKEKPVSQSEEWGSKMWSEIKADEKFGWGEKGGMIAAERRRKMGEEEMGTRRWPTSAEEPRRSTSRPIASSSNLNAGFQERIFATGFSPTT